MSAKFYTLLTEIGAAKLASAAALGIPLKITQMAVGDGGGVLPTPSAQQTALVAEKRRAALNMLYIDPQNSSQIIAEQVIPETEGGWWIREVGLFDETGALIAVGNCPESYKPQLAEGSGRTQTVRMVLITSSTDNITLKIDPAVVLATRKYVDDKVLELKVYVDDLMAKHLATADPHTQYAPKASPTFTGTPKAPTAAAGNNSTQIANTAFVQAAIAALVASSPAALDTLNELAAALGNDPNFAATMTNALAGKMDKAANGTDIADVSEFLKNLGLEESAFGYKNMVVFSAPGVTNWEVPAELQKGRKCYVKVVGGGGSGGRANGGGGGGGGGIAIKMVDLTGVSSVAITVGSGGVGLPSASTTSNGNPGGSSSFGSYCSATGGNGGGSGGSGGGGGMGSGGDFNDTSGSGTCGGSYGSASYFGGNGGGSGAPGTNSTANMNGYSAYGPGGGGAGAAFGTTAAACTSGAGFSGYVTIQW